MSSAARLLPLLPLLITGVGLLLLFDLAHHVVLALLLLGAAFASLPWCGRRLASLAALTARAPRTVGRTILWGALLLRLPLLALPPTLSDDVLRYLWDGRVAAAGSNPYLLAPEAPELSALRDGLWQRLPHRQVPTVYPPLALAGFSIAARLPFPILSWKLLVSAADLAACALLLRLARQMGLPARRTIWYAWNPLVALEVAGMGHLDVVGVAAALGVVVLLQARSSRPGSAGIRALAAGVIAALGVLAKLGPAAAFPLWARRSGRPLLFLAAALGLTAAALLPVVAASGGVPPGLVTYGVSWEWNGPLYEPLWRLLDAGGLAHGLARGLDAWKAWRGEWQRWNWLYPYFYPQFLAKLVLALAAAAVVLRSWRETALAGGTGRLFGGLLLVSATVYPWYLLWVLPWAALALHPAWLALSGLVLLSYLAAVFHVAPWPWIWAAVWGPFYLLLFLFRHRRPWSIG